LQHSHRRLYSSSCLTSVEGEEITFSLDDEVRDSSELELRPSAADSPGLKAGTEILLIGLVLLLEQEEEEECGLLFWVWLQVSSVGDRDGI